MGRVWPIPLAGAEPWAALSTHLEWSVGADRPLKADLWEGNEVKELAGSEFQPCHEVLPSLPYRKHHRVIDSRACTPQVPSPHVLEPVHHNERSCMIQQRLCMRQLRPNTPNRQTTKRSMHPHDHSRTIRNSRDMNATKVSLIDEEIKKEIWYVCKMEHCSAIKKNELLPFAATWRT